MAGNNQRARRDENDGRDDRGLDDLGDGELVPVGQGESALTAITRGEVDMQVATAKRFPRSIARFQKDALSMVTADEDTAASCFFTLPRKKKDSKTGAEIAVTGPSVRLAEIAAANWGNLRIEARPIEEGDTTVTAQGTAWDMEKNVLVRVETKRKITDKNGRRFSDDMVAMTTNAATSVAKRNAIFNVIPRSYINQLDTAARACAIGTIKTLPERREKLFTWFAKLNVTQDRVLAALGKEGLADVDLSDLETMHGWGTALKEGTSKVEDIFPPSPMPEGTTNVRKPAAAASPPAGEPPHDPKTGEVIEPKAQPKSDPAAGF
jgi:hypothetical protein